MYEREEPYIVSCGHWLLVPDRYRGDFADEAPVREQVWGAVKQGQVVLDIGASLGTYTLPALAAGATVIAVDVLGEVGLIEMARDNGLSARLTVLEGVVVADNHGYPEWLIDAIQLHGESYPEILDEDKTWVTIDQLAIQQALPTVDWIKVDTEGGELPIMRGALGVLQKYKPNLVIEEHSHLPWVKAAGSGDQLHAYLHELSYSITRLVYQNREIWFCLHPEGKRG